MAIYGELYESAKVQMQLMQESIDQQTGIGFESSALCAKWAEEHLLDLVAYVKASHSFFAITHKGSIVTRKAWIDMYCSDVLFFWVENERGQKKRLKWIPEGHKYYDDARIAAEASDGIYKPLYHRDYFTPTGYFDPTVQTFNVAKPFPVFAKETGRNTSHIYTYIEHVAGECAPWLLAWLRTKMINPKEKTQIVPIIVSRTQGTGKSTFAEIICKGLFGKDNVIVTDQYDSQSRFNADYADALIVCQEEKEETDRRNPAATIKSRATATQIRKEYKGLDPIYQDSYTEFIMTTNKDVPIKFDDREDQRRFMIMEADGQFTRKTSDLADEVFTKLYGRDANLNKVGVPFNEDPELIAQFKHELFTNEQLKEIELRKFPKTAAYQRCFTLPRTTENTEIESILRSIAPFIKAMLLEKQHIASITENEEVIELSDIIQIKEAIQYFAPLNCVAICRPAVFYDMMSNKPFQHSIVERTIMDSDIWLNEEYGIKVIPDMRPIPGGFYGMQGRMRNAPAARFCLVEDYHHTVSKSVAPSITVNTKSKERLGERLRVNSKWKPDPDGEFETLNEMKPGVTTLDHKNNNVQYMDTFLFESDSVTKNIYMIEQERIKSHRKIHGDFFSAVPINASTLYMERLRLQLSEAERLFRAGIACRIVYSGSKSYHILVRVKDEPDTLEQYKWLHAHLALELSDKLDFDASTSDPARLTRAPIIKERISEYEGVKVVGTQSCISTNWNAVYDINWRPLYKQWVQRPLAPYESVKGKRLMPTKPEYREAMWAMLNGTFWTDSKYNGQRQQLFFPAYRLCRYLGFSHNELWAEGGILDGLQSYYRQSEISYWKSREHSNIIQSIDTEVDTCTIDLE